MSAVDMYTCPEPDCDFIVGAAGPMGANEYDQFAEEVEAHKALHEPFDLANFVDAATGAPAAEVLADSPEPFSVEGMVIASGWLAEQVGECTCGGVDQYGHECHEPGCGLEPVARLDDLPGWPRTSRPTTAEGVAAIKKRLQWASIHWGTQKVSEDAWPHIADAVLSLWGAEANR